MFISEISIIILICQKSESVRPARQKIKLPKPYTQLVEQLITQQLNL